MPRARTLLSWSSGKDSAWALHLLRQRGEVEVVGLLTTTNNEYERVAMHGVRRELLRAQAEAAGLPLWDVPLPNPCSNEQYEAAMTVAMRRAVDTGVEAVAFGDLFLEDIRRYREEKLAPIGLTPLFPVWGIPTDVSGGPMFTRPIDVRVGQVVEREGFIFADIVRSAD